ncbi:MAG: LysM peptidoglycan-binding domain-containing protein [Candidatus Promineifilaceae bacterium]
MKGWRFLIAGLVLFASLALIPAVFADSSYVVQPGDTLFKIAVRFDLTTAELAAANGITNYDRIYAGQLLVIPDGEGETVPAGETTIYVVQRGDILSRIALRFGVSTAALIQANNLANPDHIYAGQRLIVPAGGVAPEAAPVNPPAEISAEERWIDVNLTTQTLVAYEGSTPVLTTLVSSGTWQYPTVTGQFHIYLRYVSQDMNGYRLGYDYYLPDVPYVQYFFRNYGLHGTYWHNNFGTPMSHGCVNLRTADAQWLYNWATFGTLVNIHY